MLARTSPDRALLALYAGFVAALAWPTLSWWAWEWTRPDSPSAYALAVVPLTVLMVRERRSALAQISRTAATPGLMLTIGALLLLALSVRRELLALSSFALLLVGVGSLWFYLGSARLRRLFVPLLFLFTLAPLPGPLLSDATLGAQNLSTMLAAKLLGTLGLAVVQSGTTIQLGRYALEVEAPCSGFKLLLTLLILGGALAALTDLSRGKKIILVLLGLPLSLGINAVRIALVGLAGEAAGFTAAHRIHDFSGYVCLVGCLGLLFASAKGLGCRHFCGLPLF